MMDQIGGVLWGFCAALAITVAVEAATAWLFGLRTWRKQLVLALINVITNLPLNLLINILAFFNIHTVMSPFDPLLIVFELIIVSIEALMLHRVLNLPGKNMVLLSLAANTASFIAGVLILWR